MTPSPGTTMLGETMDGIQKKNIYRWAAVISYIVGFIYVKYAMENAGIISRFPYMGRLVFAVVFIVCTELFAAGLDVTYNSLKKQGRAFIEPVIYMVCIILQSLAFVFWNNHEDWEIYQFLIWHCTFVYYVLARTGTLAAGRSGIMFLIDFFQGWITVPFSNFFLRMSTLLKKGVMEDDEEETLPEKKHSSLKTVITVLISLFIAFIVSVYALWELANASETMGVLGGEVLDGIERFFKQDFFDFVSDNLFSFIISIPVGCWFFGLVGGSLFKRKPALSIDEFEEYTGRWHLLPAYSAYIVLGSICLIYAAFLASSVNDFIVHKGLFAETAHEAAMRAIDSFWSLIRVVLMNFAVITGSCLFSRKVLWQEKGTRILVTILFACAFGFAILAAFNLIGVYVGFYGWTPRRILSSWVVMNVIAWCLLLIIRFYRRIPAAQAGIVLAIVSFSIIDCFKF